jgi:hypothetical protein
MPLKDPEKSMPHGTAIDRHTPVRRIAQAYASEIGGELVMMDIEKGVYFGLDAVGTEIWNRLESPATAAGLAEALAQGYDADPATIERDVLALLSSLIEHGLAERC